MSMVHPRQILHLLRRKERDSQTIELCLDYRYVFGSAISNAFVTFSGSDFVLHSSVSSVFLITSVLLVVSGPKGYLGVKRCVCFFFEE